MENWKTYDAVELVGQFNARQVAAAKLRRDFDSVSRFTEFEDILFGDAHDADYHTRHVSCQGSVETIFHSKETISTYRPRGCPKLRQPSDLDLLCILTDDQVCH